MSELGTVPLFVTDVFASHAKYQPKKTAVVYGDRRLSWLEFNQGINRVANALLSRGIKKGDKVATLLANMLETPEIMFGIIKAGAVLTPLSVMLQPDSLAFMLEDSEAVMLFVGPGLNPLVEGYRESGKIAKENFITVGFEKEGWTSYKEFIAGVSDAEPDVPFSFEDIFILMYTSGTTGTPKGILHTHYSRMMFGLGIALEHRMTDETISLVVTPMYTNGTWVAVLPTLMVGGTIVFLSVFTPIGFFETVQAERPTHCCLVPVLFTTLLAHPDFDKYDLSSLKVMVCGGAPLFKEKKIEIMERFKCQLFELYGLTEGIGTTLRPQFVLEKSDSVGYPGLMSLDIKIIDDNGKELPPGEIGEIVGRTTAMMNGYHKQPEKTAEVIWLDERGRKYLKTGDIGKMDEDGFLYLLDRKKDMIISGGINIFATDIEEVILKHPEVADCAVIGIPHEKWGETPLALIIPHVNATVTPEELKDWINERVAKYQRVSAVEFRNMFPRNALGKVLKRELRQPYWDQAGLSK